MRKLIVITLVLLVVAVLTGGCAAAPRLTADDIKQVRFSSFFDGREWTATGEEVGRFVEAYNEAKRLSNNNGTTAPARIDVTFKTGEVLRIWGGGQRFQTVEWDGEQSNIEGEKLHVLLAEIARAK